MIACQIKVDGEWLTARYVENGVEKLEETWRQRFGITEFRTYVDNEEAPIEAPCWWIELRRQQSGRWKHLTKRQLQGDLRALLVLWGRWCEDMGIDHADWRIRPYED